MSSKSSVPPFSGYVATIMGPEENTALVGFFEDEEAAADFLVYISGMVGGLTQASGIYPVHEPAYIVQLAQRAIDEMEGEDD